MNNLKDRVTIYEVAKTAGVSLATVSRVINNSSSVKEETRNKVLAVINQLGYKPSGLAQGLATNKTTNIGVIIPSANYVYLSNFLNGITEVCKNRGFTVTLYTTAHSKEDAAVCLEKVIKSHVDGVIAFDDELNKEDFNTIQSYAVPVLAINNDIAGERSGSITFGYENLFEKVMKDYFIKGNKPVVFLHVHNAGRLLRNVENNFIKLCIDNDKEYSIINCDDSYIRTYNDFLEIFKKRRQLYVVAYRDSIAAAVLNAATDLGLSVPDDVEVLSIIGTKYSSILRPQISAMHIDMQEVGRRSVYMLIDLIENRLHEKKYNFEPEYIKRDSTKY